MIWVINKKDNTPYIFGSIAALAEMLGLNPGTLYNHFSRNKKKEYENGTYRIVKCDVIRSVRNER